MSKNEPLYFKCDKCHYYTNKKSNFDRHINSKKHNDYKMITKNEHKCNCGKTFMHRQNLYRHKKKCNIHYDDTEKNVQKNDVGTELAINDDNESLMSLMKTLVQQNTEIMKENQQIMKENNEFKELVVEISKKPNVVNIQQNNFSVVNYLHNECKNAITMNEFIDGIDFTLDDLKYLHDNGCVASFNNVIVNRLTNMEHNKRPIHCTDAKRSNFFVNDNGEWIRDNDSTLITDNLKKITDKQCDTLKQWKNLNKDWLDVEEKQEFANVVTRDIVNIYSEKIQNKIINKLTSLKIKPDK
jgi:hypothetical protein